MSCSLFDVEQVFEFQTPLITHDVANNQLTIA